ncbi:MAG: hypothetical protein IKQ40_04850, partial [Lachnospiraceae bacterium]|nr:hypothetical protein [Lachnospiraceae bacterium]
GHLIGWVDEGEISGLEWIDDETVEATCRVIDDAGREKEFTKKIEYSPEDKAVFSYYEYLAGGKRDTKKLTDSAPAGAVALLMVNPPDRILDKLPAAQIYDKNAYDRAVVVSLEDGEKIRIDPNDTYVPRHDKIDTVNEQDTGDAVVYQITVPEGAPNSTLVVSTPGKEDAGWDVATLSGKSAVISRYIIAGE